MQAGITQARRLGITGLASALLLSACGLLVGEPFDDNGSRPTSRPKAPSEGDRDGDGDGGITPSSVDSAAFVDAYCELVMSCCEVSGFSSDNTKCKALIASKVVRRNRQYSPRRGERCLESLREIRLRPHFCQGPFEGGVLPLCADVTEGGTAAPGEPCVTSSDCALSDEGETGCGKAYIGEVVEHLCQVATIAKEGADCNGTLFLDGSWGQSDQDAPVATVRACSLRDELYCADSKKCVRFGSIGTACRAAAPCTAAAYCDTPKGCLARRPVGAECAGLLAGSCVNTARCSSTTKTCTTLLPLNAACDSNEVCASRSCIHGECSAAGSESVLVGWCGPKIGG